MRVAALPTGDPPHSPSASTTSTEGSTGRLTPPPSASDSEEDVDGDGDNEAIGDDGTPKMPILPLHLPGPIEIPGLELSHVGTDASLSLRAPASSPPLSSPKGEEEEPAARTPTEPHTSAAPPPEGSGRRQSQDDPERTEQYIVMAADGEDEGMPSAAFLRIVSLVPRRNIVRSSEVEGLVLRWDVVMTKSQAMELLADPNIGAIVPLEEHPCDHTDW